MTRVLRCDSFSALVLALLLVGASLSANSAAPSAVGSTTTGVSSPCTAEGRDEYGTGSLVPCCAGLSVHNEGGKLICRASTPPVPPTPAPPSPPSPPTPQGGALRQWLYRLNFQIPDEKNLILVNQVRLCLICANSTCRPGEPSVLAVCMICCWQKLLHLSGSFTSIRCGEATVETISSAYTPPQTGRFDLKVWCGGSSLREYRRQTHV